MLGSFLGYAALAASLVQAAQPNIILVITDDQDLKLGSMDFLPNITGHIGGDEGFTFTNHFTTVALCCPSRVALMRGQQAHNTNNTNVGLPGGSFQKFLRSGEGTDYLPHYLGRAGYHTEFIGKIMNGYAIYNYATVPPGWDHFDGMLDPWMYTYNTPVFSTNGATPRYYNGSYLQDVVHAKAIDRVERLVANQTANATAGEAVEPWFLMVAPTAPHQTFNTTGDWPPVPAARHANLFNNVSAPRTPNFNPEVNLKPSWIGQLPLMNSTTIALVDEIQRARLRTLQSVDEMVGHLVDTLDDLGQLDNTVIIYTADHGYHLGQHRVPCGKTLPYVEDTHVPFYMRGPGVPSGQSTEIPSNHIDIIPTLLTFAGLNQSSWPTWLDGRSLLDYFTVGNSSTNSTSPASGLDVSLVETVNVEYWSSGYVEATGYGYEDLPGIGNNSYKTVRLVSKDYSYMYATWCTGESELYDTLADPYELSPIAANSSASAARLTSRLNGLMLLLKTCIGDSCRAPWTVLHPEGGVYTLSDALNEEYDEYYASLPNVAFDECLTHYELGNEAPFFHSNYSLALSALTTPHQDAEDFGTGSTPNPADTIGWDGIMYGAVYEDIEQMEARARDLTAAELDWDTSTARFKYM